MALTPITLMTPPGGDRLHKIELNAGTSPYVTRSWEADVIDEDIRHSNLDGGVTVIEKVKRKTLLLKNVIVSRANRRLIEDLRDSREQFCVSPPWVDCTAPLTYIPLQKTLSDLRHEDTRADVVFARLSSRFNSVTGRKTLFDEPHYEDAPRGQGIHASDVINDAHFFNPELRSYLTQDAADSGATTLVYVTPAQAVLWDNYGTAVWPAGNKAYLMISNEEETTNAHELALISAINTTTGLITLTTPAGGAALGGTANYTHDKRTYISSNLISDGNMEDTGMGSWIDRNTPSLSQKTETQNETGTRALEITTDAADEGVYQVIGDIPNGTHLVILIRLNIIRGQFIPIIRGDAGTDFSETVVGTGWQWANFAWEVTGGAQTTVEVRLLGNTGADHVIIDRCYVFQGCVANGGMEGVYVNEGAGAPGVAPEWAALNVEAGDNVSESADEHGGNKAQRVQVTDALEGITTDANVFADGPWYLVGAYFKVASGEASIYTESDNLLLADIDDAAYTFRWVIWEGDAAEKLKIRADLSGGADFLVDDVIVFRLPGNPFDGAYDDLPEPLSTAGFAVETEYTPDVANTALTVDAYLWSLSRRTYDAAEDVLLYYNFTTDSFVLDVDGTTATVAKTFAAGDSVHIGCQVTGAAGSQVVRLSVKVNAAAESNNSSGAAATTPTGITRLWIGRLGSGYANMARGTVSCVLIENAAFSDANITSLLDLYSGVDAPELALLEETHGILYEINRDGVRVRGPAKGDEFRLDVLLTEVGRVGIFATQDA